MTEEQKKLLENWKKELLIWRITPNLRENMNIKKFNF